MFLERKPEPKIPDERMKELIEIKNKQRAAMKAEYLKQITDPHRHATGTGGAPVDAGIQRYMAMEATRYNFYKPTAKSAILAILTYVVPCALITYFCKTQRDERERLFRSGWVSYRDREYKFV